MKKLIEDINLAFPLSIDKTPDGKIVPCAEIGEKGYGVNINYTLQIAYQNDRAIILISSVILLPSKSKAVNPARVRRKFGFKQLS